VSINFKSLNTPPNGKYNLTVDKKELFQHYTRGILLVRIWCTIYIMWSFLENWLIILISVLVDCCKEHSLNALVDKHNIILLSKQAHDHMAFASSIQSLVCIRQTIIARCMGSTGDR